MTVPVTAAAGADEKDVVVRDWIDALTARDSATIATMPLDYPSFDEDDRFEVAARVLAGVVASDPDAAVRYGIEDEATGQEALRLIERLIFDRAAFTREIADVTAAAQDVVMPAAPAVTVDYDAHAAAAAAIDEVRAGARLPDALVDVVAAIEAGAVPTVPSDVDTTRADVVNALVKDVNVLWTPNYALCFETVTNKGCHDNLLPTVPHALDITGDFWPDVLVSLTPVVDAYNLGGLWNGAGDIALSVQRLHTNALAARVVAVFTMDGATVHAGYDTFASDLPADARRAPSSFVAVASLDPTATGETAALALEVSGAGGLLRTVGGFAPSTGDKAVTLDMTPVPPSASLAFTIEETPEAGHFEGTFTTAIPTNIKLLVTDTDADAKLSRATTLDADGVTSTFTLTVDREGAGAADTWDWDATAPLASLTYAVTRTLFADAALTTPASYRYAALELTDVPANLGVEVPGVGRVGVEASGVIGAVGHTLRTYDYGAGVETLDVVSASDVPVGVTLVAESVAGHFEASATDLIQRLQMQSARVANGAGIGGVDRLLFDLDTGASNFFGIRGETPTEGRVIALRLLQVPDVSLDIVPLVNGVQATLGLAQPLSGAEGLIRIDDQQVALTLSNLPKDVTFSARFDKAVAEVGYAGTTGIAAATAHFTNLAKGGPNDVHAYALLEELPSELNLAIGRSRDAPTLAYQASASTLDVTAFVDEAWFDGDLRARAIAVIDDLGADTVLELVDSAGKDLLKLVSTPLTRNFLLEGFLTFDYAGYLNERITSSWYEIRYGYNINSEVTIQHLRVDLADVQSLQATLESPNVKVTGTFSNFAITWETIHIAGPSAAWFEVDIIILFIRVPIWDWGWAETNGFNLDFDITPFHGHWGTLISLDVLWCEFRLDTIPHKHTTLRNTITLGALNGETWWFFMNPIDSRGDTLVPEILMVAYMVWQYGDWRFVLDC